jgi:Holliday junction DNA helicase RuvA
MIDFVRGTVAVKELGQVTLETHGVGYAIHIPLSTYEKLPGVGAEVTLKTHYYVREDGHKLFGFYTSEEREIFRHLIGISKVGPKVALNVLSGVAPDALVESVNRGDPSRLQKIPGIGAKTAQRLVMELKGKLGTVALTTETTVSGRMGSGGGITPGNGRLRDEVYDAMIALGYNEKQVRKALERIGSSISEDDPVEVWIRMALQVI